MTVWLGMDPEFQVLDKNGKHVLAHEVGFDKKKDGELAEAFRDGANVELNTLAHTCRESLASYFTTSMNKAKLKLPPGYTLAAQAAWPVTLKQIRSAPPDVREFGCKPSKDAYTGEVKIPSLDGASHKKRYAGGHIHMSCMNYDPEQFVAQYKKPMDAYQKNLWDSLGSPMGQRKYVKILDWLIGNPCTFLWDDDGQFQRRKWYGQAGEYRSHFYGTPVSRTRTLRAASFSDPLAQKWEEGPKLPPNVGVEYRVPPPQLFNHQGPLSLMFGVARHVAMNFDHYSARWDAEMQFKEEDLRAAINKGKGVEALLTTVPGWYTPEVLKKLRTKSEIYQFDMGRSNNESNWGWYYYCQSVWGIATPPNEGLAT